MNRSERVALLKNSKKDYALYWHHLESQTKPYKEGYIGVAKVTKYGDRFSGGSNGKLSDETKRLISINKKGQLLGEINPAKRPEVREKIRLSKLGNKNCLGHRKTTKGTRWGSIE